MIIIIKSDNKGYNIEYKIIIHKEGIGFSITNVSISCSLNEWKCDKVRVLEPILYLDRDLVKYTTCQRSLSIVS